MVVYLRGRRANSSPAKFYRKRSIIALIVLWLGTKHTHQVGRPSDKLRYMYDGIFSWRERKRKKERETERESGRFVAKAPISLRPSCPEMRPTEGLWGTEK